MPAALTMQSTVGWSADQIAAPVGSDVVIMSIERGNYYSLRDVAGDIWQRLEKPVKVRQLCDALIEKYDAEPAVIEQQVIAFLDELTQEGLLSAA